MKGIILIRKFNTKTLLLSSALIAGLVFTTSNQVKADTTDTGDNTNVLQISHNDATVPAKASISPVASHDNQTLRQVAAANNASLEVLEKLNDNIDPDVPIKNGTPLYLPQNSNLFAQENDAVPHSLYVKYWSHLSPANRRAKAWIAQRESGGSYTARNGSVYGRYQLSLSYLHGDLSKTNQERTANRYVKQRYGSWVNAKKFWLAHNWY